MTKSEGLGGFFHAIG